MEAARARTHFAKFVTGTLLAASMVGIAFTAAIPPASAADSALNIYFLAGATSDPFMSTIKRGADDAGKAIAANGGSVHWLPLQDYGNIGPDLVKLLRSASSSNPAAIVVPNWVPDAENPTLKEISSAGTPLILWNDSGNDSTAADGALYYIGSDNALGGKAAGEYMAKNGVKHILCINTNPGTAIQQARCSGLKAGAESAGGTETDLPLAPSNFGDQTAISQAIKAALLKDSSIDGVVTLTLQDADITVSALSQAGLTDKVKLGTFDLNSAVLSRIQGGTQMVAIDQNGYLQGYLGVSLAFQYAKWGMKLPEMNLLTGPALITKDNVAAALAGAKEGVR
ncbi:MAG TPA: substrate-binding domain-containing protein [Fimbriimonas sp.]|nr:substrate-binding domain-containing protein [Fimbriimonas sp.]